MSEYEHTVYSAFQLCTGLSLVVYCAERRQKPFVCTISFYITVYSRKIAVEALPSIYL